MKRSDKGGAAGTAAVAADGNGADPAGGRKPAGRAKRAGKRSGKRCFVISPIGDPGTDVREHADDVFDFIIKPAMERMGIVAERSDHFHEPGRISEQMLRAIVEYELCIAVLTFHNPNVFYELAIAQAMQRPVILLLESGGLPPFDIKDERHVRYTLKPRPLFEGRYADEVVSHIQALEHGGWQGQGLPGLPAAGAGGAPCTVLPAADDFGSPSAWLTLLEQAKESFSIAGINLREWRKTRGFAQTLVRKANDGCKVRVLVIDPKNPAFPNLINQAVLGSRLNEVRLGLKETTRFFKELATESPNIQVHTIATGCPHFNLTVTEREAVGIPYLYSTRSSGSPLLRCSRPSPLYASLQAEFESLWDSNS